MSISKKKIKYLIIKKVEEKVDNKFSIYARYEFAGFSEDGEAKWVPYYSAYHKNHCFNNVKDAMIALNLIKITSKNPENLILLKYSEAELLQMDKDVRIRENLMLA